MAVDSIKSIIRSAKSFFSGTLLSRVSGMIRDMSMAAAFGSDPGVAALLVSFRFSNLLRRLFGEGALHSAFVPLFEELRSLETKRAAVFFRDLSFSLMAFLFLVTFIVEAALLFFLFFGNLDPDNREIVYLTAVMFPSILFICHFGLNSSLLQCEKKYFIPSIAPAGFNFVWIAATYYFKGYSVEAAMPKLSAAIVFACFIQWAITVPHCIHLLFKAFSKEDWRSFSFFSSDVRSMLKPLASGIIGIGAVQINTALDAVFARYADLEGPAYLWYAIRIQQLPLALFGIALAGALLPPLSRAIKEKDSSRFKCFFSFSIRYCINIMLPISFFILVLGGAAVAILYGRGDFNDLSAYHTILCLWGYAIGLLPMAFASLFSVALYAKGNYGIPMRGSLAAVFFNVILNGFIVFFLKMGASGIALATSISAWINFLFLLCYLLRKGYIENVPVVLRHLCKVGASSFLSALFTWIFAVFVWEDKTLWILFSNDLATFPRSLLEQAAIFVSLSFCFFASLLLFFKLFKIRFFLVDKS